MNSSTKAVVIGCGIVGFLGLLVIGAVFAFIAYSVQDVEGVQVEISGPMEVTVGETFDLTVKVTNVRPSKKLALSDIDIAQSYLGGFSVIETKPETVSTMTLPFEDGQSFTFSSDIPPGETRDFVFTLKAQVPGIYRGDVDVCENTRFVTWVAETVVKDKENEAPASPTPPEPDAS